MDVREDGREEGDAREIDDTVKGSILVKGKFMSFEGIPMTYYGDEDGTTND